MSDFIRMDRRWKMSETATHVFFVGGPFSQWFRCEFRAPMPFGDSEEEVVFNCTEQYMMAGKAMLFGDTETLAKIMAETSPKEMKALGRQVKGYDDDRWREVARDVVTQGNLAKFGQNAALREFLFTTGDKIIVEGAWYDAVWGVKLEWSDPKIIDPANWLGTNWLGECLMAVRKVLFEKLVLELDPQHDRNW
jgi:ribA/ribD-fused uncharacterized protein